MFSVNNKDTRKMPMAILWTYSTPCSSISIVNFEHVTADWGEPNNHGRVSAIYKNYQGEHSLTPNLSLRRIG